MALTCHLYLLGGFRAEVDGRPVPSESWRHRRGAGLVKLLALTPGHRIHREQVIEALWPDLDPEAGGPNLRKAVHFARRALGDEEAVRADGGMLSLWPKGTLVVDAEKFETAALEAIRRGEAKLATRAAALYSGELLPEDPYEPWVQRPRDRLHRRYVEVLKAAGNWQRVVDVDPLDEEAHREVMRTHLEAGKRQAAMRQFERLRDVLREELGVGPDPESVAVYEQVLAVEGAEPETPAERARTHLAAGLVAMNRMDLDGAEREARAARTIAVEAEIGAELGQASGLLGMVAHARGGWRELFRAEFLEAIRGAPHLARFVFDAHLCLAEFSLSGLEKPDHIEAFARELLAVARKRGSVHGEALATLMIGEAELFSGRLEEADDDLALAAALHGEVGATAGQALSTERLAEGALQGQRPGRARQLAGDALAMAQGSELASHLLVRVHATTVLLEEQEGRAFAAVASAEEALGAMEVCDPCSMSFLVTAAGASARAGDAGRAAKFLDRADRVAGMWQGGPWLAAVWEARAELRLAKGEARQAAALFCEAAELFARCGHALSESRCLSSAASAEEAGDRRGNGSGTVQA